MKDLTTLFITQKDSGKRLDVLLHEIFPDFSRSALAKNILQNTLSVNDKPKKPHYPVKENDCVRISPAFFTPHQTSPVPNSSLVIPVIFEDAHILVVDKPAGIQVHPSATQKEKTIVNWLLAQYPDIYYVGDNPMRPGIVHRLDKDTSGVLVIAKTQESFLELKKLFSSRQIHKTYLAVAYGIFEQKNGMIDKPIARSASFRRQVIAEGRTRYKGTPRAAITQYSIKEQFPQFAIVEARPKTGRMHQIRIHLSSIGHPIVGDHLYARKEFRSFPSAPRQLLHATKIEFSLFGDPYSFESPPPKDFLLFLQKTKEQSSLPKIVNGNCW